MTLSLCVRVFRAAASSLPRAGMGATSELMRTGSIFMRAGACPPMPVRTRQQQVLQQSVMGLRAQGAGGLRALAA